MRNLIILLVAVSLNSLVAEAQMGQHEIGVNFTQIPFSKDVVWTENMSFLQALNPITYKYFLNDGAAIRASMQYSTKENEFRGFNSYINSDISYIKISTGFQRFFGNRKIKPTLFTDVSYIAEDYYYQSYSLGLGGTSDYTSAGVIVSGGAGLRYEFTSKWALAYEADLNLHTRKVNGYITSFERSESYNDAFLTNLTFNPLSNLSVNFRF